MGRILSPSGPAQEGGTEAIPASAPLSEPEPPWLGLYDYGLIGNERTGALISRTGAIDWACLPRFDSPSIFARLLDRRSGGFHQIAPRERYVSHQQYVPGTNVLTTFFELRRGVSLVVTDFMPMGPPGSGIGGDPRIARRVLARGAPVSVRIAAEPRFGYGRALPAWEVEGEVASAASGTDRLTCLAPWAWRPEGVGMVAEGRVEPGNPVFAQVRFGGPPLPEPSAAALLSVTDAYWRGWVAPADAPLRRVAARWHPWVERSELVLKLLSYAESGVFVAAPTTSLPEWIGGPRNWDYRYVWIRDAAFTAQVFLLLGHVSEARAYVAWAFDRAAELPEGEELRTLYTVDGRAPPPEEDLEHLEGYRGSRPVRVGNAAADQRQLDIYGELLDLASLIERIDPAFVRDRWPTIERLAQQTTRLWNARGRRDLGEPGPPPALRAFEADVLGSPRPGGPPRPGIRPSGTGSTGGSASRRRSGPRSCPTGTTRSSGRSSRRSTRRSSMPARSASRSRGSCRRRTPASWGRSRRCNGVWPEARSSAGTEGDDGLEGPEGSFLLCSFWLVESLAKSGRTEEALAHWRTLLDAAGPLLLFSEEYDPGSNQPLGNYPQAFTHIGVLRAAFALGLMSTAE